MKVQYLPLFQVSFTDLDNSTVNNLAAMHSAAGNWGDKPESEDLLNKYPIGTYHNCIRGTRTLTYTDVVTTEDWNYDQMVYLAETAETLRQSYLGFLITGILLIVIFFPCLPAILCGPRASGYGYTRF